jgi:hypothetical protein
MAAGSRKKPLWDYREVRCLGFSIKRILIAVKREKRNGIITRDV